MWSTVIPEDIKLKFQNRFYEKKANGEWVLLGKIPPLAKVQQNVQSSGFRKRPTALCMGKVGLFAFDHQGHWQLLDCLGNVKQEGQIDSASIRQVRMGSQHCAILSGSIISIWQQWPHGQPTIFMTGWPILFIDISCRDSLLVVGENGDWVLYDILGTQPKRITQGKLPERPIAGAITAKGDAWYVGTDQGKLFCIEGDQIRLAGEIKIDIRSIIVSHNGQNIAVIAQNGTLFIYESDKLPVFKTIGLQIVAAIFDTYTDRIFASTCKGECVEVVYDGNKWEAHIIAKVSGFLHWIERFAESGPDCDSR